VSTTDYGARFAETNRRKKRAHQLIPGGAHTYAKGDDQYPVLAPGFVARGKGCHVWDPDGNEYIEYGMGNRAVSLGHAWEPVNAAVREALENGVSFCRPATIELDCAEQLLSMIRGAEMVKFSKDGSDATSGATKIARAYTGRDLIAICSDHPFFSVDDWFIGTTAMDGGVPQAIKDLTVGFRYNDIESAKALFVKYPGQIACCILEASRGDDPADNFLHKLRDLCHANGALFILDEMITGFRWHKNGAQHVYDITPDLSTFGKAIANGFSVSALAGKREFMRLGGLDHTDKKRVFLMSTTHGGETHGLAAAIATMKIYESEPVVEHLHRQGARLRAGCEAAIVRRGVGDFVKMVGRDCNMAYATAGPDGKASQAYRSLFLQEMIRRGVLGPSFVVGYAHSDADIDRTIEAVDEALAVYAQALEAGAERFLVGRPSQIVYRAYNIAEPAPAA
jgi:glutamate-1-semialdehyde 2,1-aminomutase